MKNEEGSSQCASDIEHGGQLAIIKRRPRATRTAAGEFERIDLSDSALLATLLGANRQPAKLEPVTDQLLDTFGNLRSVLNADGRALSAISGIGPVRLQLLRILRELAQRHFEQTLPVGVTIKSPMDTESFLMARLRDRPHEVFCCLYLDNRHRVIRFVELFRGTIDGTSVYPREIVKQALSVNAAAVILAHNHPSGVAEPSQADERITRRVRSALELVDIRLLDHLIIGDGKNTSLAGRGLL